MWPRVMPRPIHLTRVMSPRSSISSLPLPSMSKSASSRSWRLPSRMGRARTSAFRKPTTRSGEMTSASIGTFGGSLRERVSMGNESVVRALVDLHAVDAVLLHGVIVERYRVILLEQRPNEVLDLLVIGGPDDELAAFDRLAHLAFLDDDLAALDDVAR